MQMKDDKIDIDELITSYLAGELDQASFSQLEEWTMDSDANRNYVRNKIELWFSSAASSGTFVHDESKAFTRFRRRIEAVSSQDSFPQTRKKMIYWKVLYRVAAVLIIVLLPLAGYYQGKYQVKKTFADIVVEASPGTNTKLTLPDGTLVWLNAGSKIIYSQGFGVDDRFLSLSGEGYFEVTRNEKMPFQIRTREVSLKVLGTKFNFRDYDNDEEVIVSLMEGKVALENELHTMPILYLESNEKMVMNKQTGEMMKTKANVELANVWKDNKLFFDEELLKDIAKKLMRCYDVRIEVPDSLASRRFYGDFVIMKQTIDEVLTTMAETGRMRYRYEDGKYILY